MAGKQPNYTFMKVWFSKNNSKLFVLGFVSSSIQLLLLKEVMNIAGGYELIAGGFLGSWLLLSALGSWLGGITRYNNLSKLYTSFSISPLISLLLLVIATTSFINPGETISIINSILLIIIITAPVCLISGFTFIRLIELAVLNEHAIPGKSFSIETVGGIAAGIVISLLSSGYFNTYFLILAIVIFSVTYTLSTFYINTKQKKKILYIIASCSVIILFFLKPDLFFRNILMQGTDINYTKDTNYGNISISENDNEPNIFYNQRLVSYSNDVIDREEDIHYAMLQRETHKNILVISGDMDSHVSELKKYNPDRIIYIERDPWLISLTSTSETKSINQNQKNGNEEVIISTDAFTYLKSDTTTYDAIILLVPPPSTLSLNRFYTRDFYVMAKKRLSVDGVLLCSPGPAENYPNDESLKLYSSIYNSLDILFEDVRPVIGNKLFFIASDEPLSLSFGAMAEQANIRNSYVNKYYLADDILTYKSDEFKSWLLSDIKHNTIARPIACFYYQAYNISKYMSYQSLVFITLIIIILIPVLLLKRKNILMFFSATALTGFEMIALFLLQVTAGNMYKTTGLVIATVMAGLAIGSGVYIAVLDKYDNKIKMTFIAIFYTTIGLLFPLLLLVKQPHIATIIILLLVMPPAIVTGSLFRELTYYNGKGTATSHVYCADITGSAAGSIIVSAFMIPIIGLQLSIFILAILSLLGLLLNKVK